MMRIVQSLNWLGLAALVALCAVQWQTNSRLNLHIDSLEKIRLNQIGAIAARDQSIEALKSDLEEFRGRLDIAESQLKSLRKNLGDVTRQRDGLAEDKARLLDGQAKLNAALDQWKNAVAQRDAAIAASRDVAEHLTADRSAAVVKFNDLAEKYNELVKDWNAHMSTTTAPAPAASPAK